MEKDTVLLLLLLLLLLLFTSIDINECVSGVHNCHSSASCTNTVGSYSCLCNHPFTGDGKICMHPEQGEYFMLMVFWKQRLNNNNNNKKKKKKTAIGVRTVEIDNGPFNSSVLMHNQPFV